MYATNRRILVPDYFVRNFNKGVITRIEKESIPAGAAANSKNWLTMGDHIELRRGQTLMGTNQAASGNISGMKVGTRVDGTKVLFRTRLRKLEYYNEATSDWVEANTANLLPVAASGEDVCFAPYTSLPGAMMYLTSPNSSIYKVPLANPADPIDQASTTFRGKMVIHQNRTILWNRKDSTGGFDPTGLFLSYIDHTQLSDYTQVTGEAIGTGDGATKTFTGTLAFKSSHVVRSCMFVTMTDTLETFVDNRSGTLVGSLGGTGTINYATGVYSITFNTAPVNLQAVTGQYYWEDATAHGIVDFSKDTPRTAGQGAIFRQDDGGADMQNVFTLGADEYCVHTLKSWRLTLSADDTKATNNIYRSRIGIPHWRAGVASGDGIYLLNSIDKSNPKVELLKPGLISVDALATSISDNLDLSGYDFSKCSVFEWGVYIVVNAMNLANNATANDTMFLYNKLWKSWDILDVRALDMEDYNGILTVGDSASMNVFQIFSGLTDEEADIDNFWESGKMRIYAYNGVFESNRLELAGLIGPDQKIKVSVALDDGGFVEVGGSDDPSTGVHTYAIQGNGSYVDKGQAVTIGSTMIGQATIGGGTPTGSITANPFSLEMKINTDKYEYIRIRFEAVAVGWAAITRFGFKDNRLKNRSMVAAHQV